LPGERARVRGPDRPVRPASCCVRRTNAPPAELS
jgi:hypothetical protein